MKTIKAILLLMGVLVSMTAAANDNYLQFSSLTTPDKPNHYLMCPKDFCPAAKVNWQNHVYEIPPQTLVKYWDQMIKQQPRVTEVYANLPKGQWQYIQRSLVFGFEDEITVQFIPIDRFNSTLAIYSRSKMGYYDFGVNGRRVHRWMKALDKIIADNLLSL